MNATTRQFAKECREEVKHYRGLARQCKSEGLLMSRETFVKLALRNRENAKRWDATV